MAAYHTRSRKQIISFLASKPEQGFTAEELTEELQQLYGEDAPGKSTVYRLVGRLEQEQEIKRYEEDGSKRSYYRIAGRTCHDHLHLKCMDCGRIIHMEEQASALLLREVLRNNDFSVDEYHTVLMGHCNACKKGAITI